jgi:hypothetical protein
MTCLREDNSILEDVYPRSVGEVKLLGPLSGPILNGAFSKDFHIFQSFVLLTSYFGWKECISRLQEVRRRRRLMTFAAQAATMVEVE